MFFWLILAVLATFVALHLFFDPRFFLKDDTISYYLPNVIVQGETLFKFRQVPQINLYQLLGHPLLPQAQSGVFYPPHYLFYLIAAAAGDVELFVPLEVGFHILLAAGGMFCLLRSLGPGNTLCFVGAYGYAFNGFMIDVGRNWLPVPGYMAWLPVVFLCAIRYARGRSGLAPLVLVHLPLLTLGHGNFYVYIVLFETFLFVLLTRSGTRLAGYFLAHAAVAVLGLPLLLPVAGAIIASVRIHLIDPFQHSVEPGDILRALLLPPHRARVFSARINTLALFNVLSFAVASGLLFAGLTRRPAARAAALRCRARTAVGLGLAALLMTAPALLRPPPLTSVGDLLTAFFIHGALAAAALRLIKAGRPAPDSLALWATLMLAAAALSMGRMTLLSYFLYPLVTLFRWPFKWYLLVQPCLTITGALLLSRIPCRLPPPVVGAAVMALLAANTWVVGSRASVYSVGFVPVSEASGRRVAGKIAGRVVGVENYQVGGTTEVFGGNVASYYRVLAFGGYDPLISAGKAALIGLNHHSVIDGASFYAARKEVLNAYGVQTYLAREPWKYSFLSLPEFDRLDEIEGTHVYRNKAADPVVFVAGTKLPLPYRCEGNRVSVTLGPAAPAGEIVVSFLKADGWEASVDGRSVAITGDGHGRMIIPVAAGESTVTLTYRDPPFRAGLYVAAAFCVALALGGLIAKIREKRSGRPGARSGSSRAPTRRGRISRARPNSHLDIRAMTYY